MKRIVEPERVIDVLAETDVLVVGSGPGGLAAAIAAAREGVSVILAERYGCFGGVISQVGVEGIAWYRHEGTTDVEGIGIEFEQRAKALGGTNPEPQSKSEALDAEMFKYVADQLVKEAGVRPLLHTAIVAPILEGNKLMGVITESKMGRKAILAQTVIDASGDADLTYRAGTPCVKMPKDEMLGVTVMFSCSGINKARFMEYIHANPTTYGDWNELWGAQTTGKEDDLFSPYLEKPFKLARDAGIIPENIKSIGGTWSSITDAGEATNLNMVYMTGYDCTDVWDLTAAEIEGRRQAIMAIEALRAYLPGFENAKLRNFGMTLGTRDSRKIVSDYILTGQDVRNQAQFEDSIGIFPEFLDGYGVLVLPTTGRYFQVPYRILVPQKVEGLLVAGRCVAGDKIAHTATRSMMCCTVTGQGAGVAAATAVKTKTTPRTVNINIVQQTLKNQGVRLY
ncbi:MAG: FAD-dependent oxidoreductase [Ardenticatenaceae bacterium]|nr:FAD-dependent oxidoreductase [Ardenticatenaceae bacterium]MCB9444626.1 FAD-dependent oxidoreductase [Ardenticatenaceae bacterium]